MRTRANNIFAFLQLLALFSVMFCVLDAFGQAVNVNLTEEIADAEKKAFKAAFEAQVNNPYYRGYFDVKKQAIRVQVTPGVRFISGTVTTELEIVEDGFSSIELNCSNSLTVLRLTVDQKEVEFTHKDDILTWNSSGKFQAGTSYRIGIEYEGIPPETRAFSADTNVYGDSVLWTLSEPYGAKDWWPCKQDLEDKIEQLELQVIVPKKYKVAANGLLHRVDTLGDTNFIQYHWRHNYPIVSYLVAFSVADYLVVKEELDLKEGKLDFVNYIYPQDSAEAVADLKEFKKTMELFEELFGPYPFRKEQYGHAQFGWGGGMEHQTMSFMVHFKHGLVAHELAHQWFGDMVTCGTWKDLWLNESFATYCEGLTYNYLFDEGVWENWKRNSLDAITGAPDGSVNIPDTADVGRMFSSRLTYRKGSYLLHMLRYKMGDESFYMAIRDYLEDAKNKYGFARTEDLIWHLKANGGYKIDEFFEDWFYSQGYPTYTLEWHQTEQGKLHLVLSQEQSFVFQGTFFDMEVPVRIIDDFGDTTIVFDHFQNAQEIIVDWKNPVRLVYLDQDNWVLKGPESKVVKSDYQEESVEYKISPNPVSNELKLRFSKPMLPEISVAIYDIMGNRVYKQTFTTGIAQRELNIETSALSNGAYTMSINDYWGTRSLKFVKAEK